MFSAFFEIIFGFLSFLFIPLVFVGAIFAVFAFLVGFNIIIGYLHGKRFKKAIYYKRIKNKGILRRLFVDLPKQIAQDKFNNDPDAFRPHGLIIFEGRQGNGKTISMCEYATRLLKEYSNAKCLSNLKFEKEDISLNHWKKLVNFKNGKYGVVAMLDETQNWFSSKQSKDFPPEMLEVITQNRKNRRVILGTAQNFYLLSKAIRSQTTEVRRCATLFGCLTIVRRYYPILDSEGNVKEWKRKGSYFFVHSKELRNSYDTYHVIESLSKSGFKEKNVIQIDRGSL